MKTYTIFKFIFILTIAVMVFVFGPGTARNDISAQSLSLANPGFESGATSWINLSTSGARTVDSTVARTGTRSAKLLPSITGVYQDISVQAGVSYTIRGYMKTQNVGGGSFTWIRADFFNASGNVISGIQIGTNPPSTSSGWVTQETTVTAPAGSVKARIKLFNSASGSIAWFDDISITALSATIKVKRINPGGSLFTPSTTAYIDGISSNANPYTKTVQPISIAHTASASTLSGYLIAYGTCTVSNNTNGDCTPSSYSPGNSFTIAASTMPVGGTYVVAYRYIQDTVQLVKNPGFESGVTNWKNLFSSSSATNTIDSTVSNTGVYSAKLKAWPPSTSNPPLGVEQSFSVQPGIRYTIRGFAKTQFPYSSQAAALQLRFFNSSGYMIGSTNNNLNTNNIWKEALSTVTATTGATKGTVLLFNVNSGGTAWFDDIRLTRRSQTPLAVGNRVQTMTTVNVRNAAFTTATLLGTQSVGKLGTLIAGPVFGNDRWWWNIDYDNSPDGWSPEIYLEKTNLGPPPGGGTPPATPLNFSATLQCLPPNYYVKLNWSDMSNATNYIIRDCREVNKSSCVLGTTTVAFTAEPMILDFDSLSLKNYPPYIPSSTSTVIKGYAVASYNLNGDTASALTATKFVTIPAHPCTATTTGVLPENPVLASKSNALASVFSGVKSMFTRGSYFFTGK